MKKNRYTFTAIKYLNTLLLLLPFAVSWFVYYEPITLTAQSRQVTVLMLLVYAGIFYWLCYKMDGFRLSVSELEDVIFNQMISIAVTNLVCFFIVWMLSIHIPNPLPGLLAFLVQCLIIPALNVLLSRAYKASHKPQRALVIYEDRTGVNELLEANVFEKRFEVKGCRTAGEVLENPGLLDEADVVFLFGVRSHERNVILKQCTDLDKQLYIVPRIGDLIMSATEEIHMLHLPILRSKRYNPTVEYRFAKRLMDLIISGIGLIVFFPVMVAVFLAVRSDGGPAIYRQERLTKNGKVFRILKFRSMCVDAEKYSGAVLSSGDDDPRITPVGRIIRKFRLDELPQIINIFRGDMSIVGPRPERPEVAAQYEKELPEFRLRLQAKAGLTGYAQVYGKYNTSPYDKLLMDLIYIAHPGIFEDIRIILATIKTLFDKESTEGVSDQRTGRPM